MRRIKKRMRNLYWSIVSKQLDGIGVIEIILILVIIIGLIVIFRSQIEKIIQAAFTSINGDAGTINKGIKIETGG